MKFLVALMMVFVVFAGVIGGVEAQVADDHVAGRQVGGSYEVRDPLEVCNPDNYAVYRSHGLPVTPWCAFSGPCPDADPDAVGVDSDCDGFTDAAEARQHSNPLKFNSHPYTQDDCDRDGNYKDNSPEFVGNRDDEYDPAGGNGFNGHPFNLCAWGPDGVHDDGVGVSDTAFGDLFSVLGEGADSQLFFFDGVCDPLNLYGFEPGIQFPTATSTLTFNQNVFDRHFEAAPDLATCQGAEAGTGPVDIYTGNYVSDPFGWRLIGQGDFSADIRAPCEDTPRTDDDGDGVPTFWLCTRTVTVQDGVVGVSPEKWPVNVGDPDDSNNQSPINSNPEPCAEQQPVWLPTGNSELRDLDGDGFDAVYVQEQQHAFLPNCEPVPTGELRWSEAGGSDGDDSDVNYPVNWDSESRGVGGDYPIRGVRRVCALEYYHNSSPAYPGEFVAPWCANLGGVCPDGGNRTGFDVDCDDLPSAGEISSYSDPLKPLSTPYTDDDCDGTQNYKDGSPKFYSLYGGAHPDCYQNPYDANSAQGWVDVNEGLVWFSDVICDPLYIYGFDAGPVDGTHPLADYVCALAEGGDNYGRPEGGVYHGNWVEDAVGWRLMGTTAIDFSRVAYAPCEDTPNTDEDGDGVPTYWICARQVSSRGGEVHVSSERWPVNVGDPDDSNNQTPIPSDAADCTALMPQEHWVPTGNADTQDRDMDGVLVGELEYQQMALLPNCEFVATGETEWRDLPVLDPDDSDPCWPHWCQAARQGYYAANGQPSALEVLGGWDAAPGDAVASVNYVALDNGHVAPVAVAVAFRGGFESGNGPGVPLSAVTWVVLEDGAVVLRQDADRPLVVTLEHGASRLVGYEIDLPAVLADGELQAEFTVTTLGSRESVGLVGA